jgi:transcription-repair coupling factor (superfamily II helicase)
MPFGGLEKLAIDLGPLVSKRIARRSEPLERAADALRNSLAVDVSETQAAARPAIAAALWRLTGGQLVVWTATVDDADRYAGDCTCYLSDARASVWVLRPRDDAQNELANPTDHSARLETLAALASFAPGIYCIPHAAAGQGVMAHAAFVESALRLRIGAEVSWEGLLLQLTALGYERADVVSAVGEFAVRGGLIDVFPATAALPVRLEFFGDRLESARTFGLIDQRSIAGVEEIFVAPWREPTGDSTESVFSYAPGATVLVDDPELIAGVDHSLRSSVDEHSVAAADEESSEEGAALRIPPRGRSLLALQTVRAALDDRPVLTFAPALEAPRVARAADLTVALPCGPAPAYGRSIERFVEDARAQTEAGTTVAVISIGHRRIREVLAEHDLAVSDDSSGRLLVGDGVIDEGFTLPALHLVVLCDTELFGHPARRHKPRPAKESVPVTQT